MKRKEGPRPSQFVTSQMPLTTYTSHYATPACSFLHCAHSHNSHPCCCLLLPPTASWLRINNSHLCCHSMQFLFLDIQNSRLRCFRLSLLKRIGQQQYCELRICCLSLQPLGERQLTSTLLQPISSQTPWTTAIGIPESEWDLGLRNLSLLTCPWRSTIGTALPQPTASCAATTHIRAVSTSETPWTTPIHKICATSVYRLLASNN